MKVVKVTECCGGIQSFFQLFRQYFTNWNSYSHKHILPGVSKLLPCVTIAGIPRYRDLRSYYHHPQHLKYWNCLRKSRLLFGMISLFQTHEMATFFSSCHHKSSNSLRGFNWQAIRFNLFKTVSLLLAHSRTWKKRASTTTENNWWDFKVWSGFVPTCVQWSIQPLWLLHCIRTC